MTSPDFPSPVRAASELTVYVDQQNESTWDAIVERMNAYLDWTVLPRPTELRCGAGVPEWFKRVLPAVRDQSSPFGLVPYSGIRIVETDDLSPGRYVVVDQYGTSMLEGEVPA